MFGDFSFSELLQYDIDNRIEGVHKLIIIKALIKRRQNYKTIKIEITNLKAHSD